MEHEAEYERLVRRGSYYEELLRMGHVVARVADTNAWRDEIRAKARADKIKVRTGLSNQDEHVAWAYLKHLDDKVRTDEYDPRLADHLGAVEEAFGRARLRGHTLSRVIRAEGTRAATACPDCGARLYILDDHAALHGGRSLRHRLHHCRLRLTKPRARAPRPPA